MKRIVTVQDISCLGKCSLTVALPIISAMGTEAVILPTAVLSTHTMFHGFTCKDLSDQIEPISDHWAKEGFDFDAIYTGYLACAPQIHQMIAFFERFGKKSLKVVDPAMGDNGKLYPAFDMAFAGEMAKLCAVADIVMPNMTEACFMLGLPYEEHPSRETVYDILKRLTALGAKKALLTGIGFEKGQLGVVGYDGEQDRYFEYFNESIPAKYHGTGDIFSSTVVGALMADRSLEDAAAIAADFTAEAIRKTLEDQGPHWYGVHFEQVLPSLMKRMEETK
ncbi:MAG: pyridoxamine kinase [Clostridia bacterium]|nr:pyridoxamine kinase [Clostridia bacterium]